MKTQKTGWSFDLQLFSASALAAWTNQGSARANPKTGDTTAPAGSATSTALLSNPNVARDVGGSQTSEALPTSNNPLAQPVPLWIGLIVLYFVWKYLEEHHNVAGEGIARKLNVRGILLTTLEVVIGLTFLKWIFGTWKLPGLSQLVLAA